MLRTIAGLIIQAALLIWCMSLVIGKNALPDMKPLIIVIFIISTISTVLFFTLGFYAILISFALYTGVLWFFYKIEIIDCFKIVGLYTLISLGLIYLRTMISF